MIFINSSVLEQRSQTLKSSLLIEVKGASRFPPFKISDPLSCGKRRGHVGRSGRHRRVQVALSLSAASGRMTKNNHGLNAAFHAQR